MQQSSDRIMQLTTSAMYFKRKELGILKAEIIYIHPNYVEIIYKKNIVPPAQFITSYIIR
jgi:hypothetical protein